MDVAQRFIARSRHYLAYEYPTKIQRCVDVLPAHALWHRANAGSNSIGNLLLHLSGNVRQWIVGGVGGEPCDRNRDAEFSAAGGVTKPELLSKLTASVIDADRVMARLTEDDLRRDVTIQGRDTNVFAAVYHVVEHFSMHTGQIIMLAKMYSSRPLRFYENADGIAIPVWGGSEKLSNLG